MPKTMMQKTLQGYFLDEVDGASVPYKSYYDIIQYAPASELEVRRRKIACLDSILVKERERHRQARSGFQERWNEAVGKMKEVDQAILKFDEHYKESNDERERCLRLAARQDELKDIKLADIRRLRKEKEFLRQIKRITEERGERFQPVQKYLERVRDDSQGEFKSLRELLDRFTLLSTTRGGLMDRDTRARELLRRRTKQLNDLKLIKANEAVSLNNHIFEMREEFEELKNKLQRLDEDFLHIKTTAAQRAMSLGQVRIATYNLYLQVCRKLGRKPKIPSGDTIKQLHYIQNSMVEMNKLRREVKHILKDARELAEKEKRHLEMEEIEKAKKSRRHKPKRGDVVGLFGLANPHPINSTDHRSGTLVTPNTATTEEGRDEASHQSRAPAH